MAIPKSKDALDIRFLSVVSNICEGECSSTKNTGRKKLSYTTEQVFKKLYEKYYKIACQFATEKIGDAQLAEDIVADVFVTLMQQIDRLPDPYQLEAYLFYITRKKCLDHIKKQQRIAKSISTFNLITPSNEAEIEAEISFLIYDELSRLSPQRKQIMIQLYMKGLTSQQVARRMKLSRQTVLNQKVKTLKALRDNILRRLF